MSAPHRMTDADKRRSVGLSGLQRQYVRKVAKKGFEFTVMVAGEASLGKSTLIETLFMEPMEHTPPPRAAARIAKTTSIEPHSTVIQDNGIQLKLNVIDTPGFQDAVNNTNCWEPLVKYIDDAFLKYLQDESRLDRRSIDDQRVHCLLYFISPNSHGLKPVDVKALQALHEKVNIVPVIGKSDMLTKGELKLLKRQVMEDFAKHGINHFQPAVDEEDEDGTGYLLMDTIPFALVGSNKTFQVAGKQARGRMYPWGLVEVDNPDHCDFALLRDMIVRTHLNDMKDYTVEFLYEAFRKEHLRVTGGSSLSQSLANETMFKDKAAEIQRQQELKQQELERKEAEIRQQLEEIERQRQRIAASKQSRRSVAEGDTAV